jgi:hypothetical protein
MQDKNIILIKSKQEATFFAKKIRSNTDLFIKLLNNCTNEDIKLARKSAWIISAAFDLNKLFFKSNTEKLWTLILQKLPNSVERSLIRIVSEYEISEEFAGPAFDLCFQRLLNPETAIANRAFSLKIALKIAHTYPEFKQELKTAKPTMLSCANNGLAFTNALNRGLIDKGRN